MTQPTDKDMMQEILRRISQKKFFSIEPYEWQKQFYASGSNDTERMLMAGNRTGKTFAAAYEFTSHATGYYPDWWEGFRVTEPSVLWASSLTNETSRDIVQRELIGPVEQMGTGMIPGNLLKKPTFRQAGISGVIDTIVVKGKYGLNTVQFKTAEQGWQKFQGTNIAVVWQDEEPDDFKVYTEELTRILTSHGRLMVTFTPLKGETDLVQHYMVPSDHRSIHTATWDDAPHLSEEQKKIFLAAYPPHERDTRTKGLPMMGEGAIFPINDEDIEIAPFPIPDYWPQIAGVDFGINHPAAGSWIAYDPNKDIIYVHHCYKKANEPNAAVHASIINRQGDWQPVAWPHDGINRDKAGKRVAIAYSKAGINMMDISARYDDDTGGPQAVEPIVMEVYTRLSEGRMRVFSNQSDWFAEKRGMYRKDGVIKAINDDIMKATFYAVMMLRYAVPKYMAVNIPAKPKHTPLTSYV